MSKSPKVMQGLVLLMLADVTPKLANGESYVLEV